MKKSLRVIILFLGIVACDNTGNKSNEILNIPPSKGFHFAPKHGRTNQPISLFLDGETYHLFYTTGSNEWGHAISDNLVHWSPNSSIELPDNVLGDVIIDLNNLSGFSTGSVASWVIIYTYGDEIKVKYTIDRINWIAAKINLPESVTGIPKVAWYDPTEKWIMTVTNDQNITFLSSENLVDWNQISEYILPWPASYSTLFRIGTQWGLLVAAENTMSQLGVFNGDKFSPESEFSIVDLGIKSFKAITYFDNDDTYLIGASDNQFFTARGLKSKMDFSGNKILTGFPSRQLSGQSNGKRRGKLSTLRGDKASWYQFTIDTLSNSLDLLISNDLGELVLIHWENGSNELTIDKTSANNNDKGEKTIQPLIIENETIQIDLLIDYNLIELFINQGETQITIAATPSKIYDKVDLKVDDKYYDARTVLLGISSIPISQ